MGSISHVHRRGFMTKAMCGVLGGSSIASVVGCSDEEAVAVNTLPYFSLQTPGGSVKSLQHYVNQPLLMNFWATWCEPCRREMSDLESLHMHWGPKGLKVVAVSVDRDTHLVREFLLRESISFTVLLDPQQSLSRDGLNISNFPTTLLVNRTGQIRKRIVGAKAWMDAPVQRIVADQTGL
jgi:thiol-disulfide isomerase/thioredoxin